MGLIPEEGGAEAELVVQVEHSGDPGDARRGAGEDHGALVVLEDLAAGLEVALRLLAVDLLALGGAAASRCVVDEVQRPAVMDMECGFCKVRYIQEGMLSM